MPKENDKINETKKTGSFDSDKISIITDEPVPSAPDLSEYSKTLSSIIINSPPKFTAGIYGGWGTGKTTLMQLIQHKLDNKQNTVTVWFDAWRYENEEFSALVPLVGTIILNLEKYVQNLKFKKGPRKAAIKGLVKKFKKMGSSIMRSSKPTIGFGSWFSFQTDIDKTIERYKSKGSFFKNQREIFFHDHISDQVKFELKSIRNETNNFRIVIFIDDLDRCTPERALEILESIKTFFDIEGIVFVIGIDPSTIDPIIKTKYGKDSRIDGMKYLQKIVQLPYTIPLWNQSRLSEAMTSMMEETHLPDEVIEEILKPKMQKLITKATELNPRDVKRFINSIVTSQIYREDIHDIEKIIAVQAFYFHGDKWLEFLKLLLPYEQRIAFLTHFILWLSWLKEKSTPISNLYDFKNILLDSRTLEKDEYVYKSLADKLLLGVYKKLIDIDDNELFAFLSVSNDTLLRIDRIEKYLILSDPTAITGKVEKFEFDSRTQLNLIHNGRVKELNKLANQGIPIHLPFVELPESDLHDLRAGSGSSLLFESNLYHANLSGSWLPKANLIRADLSRAELSGADLSYANLSGAKMYRANLSDALLYQANLSDAHLDEANLTRTNLSEAELPKAILIGAHLIGANMTESNLSGASLSRANLSDSYLCKANLTNADLSAANLSGTVIVNSKLSDAIIVKDTDFSGAIIDDPDSLKYLHERKSRNIPVGIKNKLELREKLLERNFDQNTIESLLSSSQLPEV